jgi:hypothetical protein
MAPEISWMVSQHSDGRLRWTSSGDAVWTHEPTTGWWRRFKSGVLARLPIEKYL